MGKIHFKIPFDPLHWWIVITVFDLRKFFLNQLHQLLDPQDFPRVRQIDAAQVPVGVDVEVAPLDHFQARVFDESAQGFVFLHRVGLTGESKVVDARPTAVTVYNFDGFRQGVKIVVVGAVIRRIDVPLQGVGADPDAVEAHFAQCFYGIGFAAVGIDVDRTFVGEFSDFDDGIPDGFPHQQGFTFAALPKADQRIRG